MKKLMIFLLAVMMLTACGHDRENGQEAAYRNITAEEAKAIMDSEDGFLQMMITREDYLDGHTENRQ